MARATINELKKNRLATMTADERAVFRTFARSGAIGTQRRRPIGSLS
jgi:hypothetical protein